MMLPDVIVATAPFVPAPSAEAPKIAQANNIRPENLKLGMKLRLPGLTDDKPAFAINLPVSSLPKSIPKASESAKTKSYTVKPGDTLHSIVRRTYGSTGRLSEVIRLNGIEDEDSLTPGATLKLP